MRILYSAYTQYSGNLFDVKILGLDPDLAQVPELTYRGIHTSVVYALIAE